MKPKTRYLAFSAGAFFLSSLILFFVPVFPREANALMATVLAIIFWMFFIAGIIFTVLLSKNNPSEKPKIKWAKKLFRFFKTKPLKIIDTILTIAFLSAILTMVFQISTGWLGFLIIFLILSMIELHCVFVYAE